jgi:hypothetical protein
MAAEDNARTEITRLPAEITRLRSLVNSERDAGGANHTLLLAWAQLIDEKTDRIQELQELQELHQLRKLRVVHEYWLAVVARPSRSE